MTMAATSLNIVIDDPKEVLLLGDLVARSGWKIVDPFEGRYGENLVNDNNERLIGFFQKAR